MNALLVVDIQKGLTNKNKLYNAERFYATVNEFISFFRASNHPVLFVQHNNKFLIENTPEWEIDDRIDNVKGDIIIQKHHADAFRNTDLNAVLKELGVTQVSICGLASHSCIKHTCKGSRANGYETFLIRNAHTCWKKNADELIDITEKDLRDEGVNLIDAENIL